MSAHIHAKYETMIIPSGKRPTMCYFCGKQLKGADDDIGGVVFWDGMDGPIAFHQVCSVHFSIHLIQDARSLVSITGEEIKLVGGEKKNRRNTWYYKKLATTGSVSDVVDSSIEELSLSKESNVMEYFSEKATQIEPIAFEAFGFEISSRYGKSYEIIEMLQFAERVALEHNEKYVSSVFYDSKACICTINLISNNLSIDILEMIHAAAKKTIKQFRWDDGIDQMD